MKGNKNWVILAAVEVGILITLLFILQITLQKNRKMEIEIKSFDKRLTKIEKTLASIDEENGNDTKKDVSLAESEKSDNNNSTSTVSENDVSVQSSDSISVNDVSGTSIQELPDRLETIFSLPAGEILPEEKIDMVNLNKYFIASVIAKGDSVYDRIIGKSYVENDNLALEDLRYVKLLHRNYQSQPQVGELIVNNAIADDIIEIFMELYRQNYQICSMHLIDDYWVGDGEKSDYKSIDADNTSAFCYRYVTGSDSNLSKHAYGCAIDLNPMENPYVRVQEDGSRTANHENAQDFIYDRTSDTPHVIDENDLAYQLFTERGFEWGGHWDNPIDYQHFEKKLF